MNIKCFFGFHDWQIVDIHRSIHIFLNNGGYYDKVCLKCKKVNLEATQYRARLAQARNDFTERQQKAKKIMAEFLEKK